MSDGYYFVPDNEGGYNIHLFDYSEDNEYIEESNLGPKYHIAFFYDDENGKPVHDETFEAIFIDPITYIKTLVGSKYYGIIARKTTASTEWFSTFVEQFITKLEKLHNG